MTTVGEADAAAAISALIDTADTVNGSNRNDNEDIVDLTSEPAETSVIDLTDDSVVLVDEGPQRQRDRGTARRPFRRIVVPARFIGYSRTRSVPGMVNCPICFDNYSEIMQSGRVMVSTICGHTFCSQCLRDSLTHARTCPTCRKKLTNKQYHPIYF